MACNENIVKNIASEVTRNCTVHVDTEFVVYLLDLLLLNPKYGKLFSKTINRNNLQYFVEECVAILSKGGTALTTLKMQFLLQSNYDKLQNLIDKHLASIENCLSPLVSEILEEETDFNSEEDMKKLFRKISIYIILCSGLGNPGHIVTLKEGMAALESVFSLDDLRVFIAMPSSEKLVQLDYLLEIVSGVRLFNRDCRKGGEGIQDLPCNLVDAGKASLTSLSNSLITVMQRVNLLTTAIEDSIVVEEETGNVVLKIRNSKLTEDDYKQVFDLLAFHRQYEVFVRKLLTDVEHMVHTGTHCVDRFKTVLEEIHTATKYKTAVPIATVFPLFSKLWRVWRSMQNVMYLVSVVMRLMSALGVLQDSVTLPHELIEQMVEGRKVLTDQDRMTSRVSLEERLSLGSIRSYVSETSHTSGTASTHVPLQFLGFCAISLVSGALVPSNMKIGAIKFHNKKYGFSSVKMAAKFSKDPQRYINEVLNYARNNPQVINLLNIVEDVFNVRDIDNLVVDHVAKTKVFDKPVQTEVHPIEEYIEKNYTWDLWEWKRRACQWSNIVNCRTHSTQTYHSHLRSEIHCQTFEYRDKCEQTKVDKGISTNCNNTFLWGLRGQIGTGQHSMDISGEPVVSEKLKAKSISACTWPCFAKQRVSTGTEEEMDFAAEGSEFNLVFDLQKEPQPHVEKQ